jgi:hypothetical protein
MSHQKRDCKGVEASPTQRLHRVARSPHHLRPSCGVISLDPQMIPALGTNRRSQAERRVSTARASVRPKNAGPPALSSRFQGGRHPAKRISKRRRKQDGHRVRNVPRPQHARDRKVLIRKPRELGYGERIGPIDDLDDRRAGLAPVVRRECRTSVLVDPEGPPLAGPAENAAKDAPVTHCQDCKVTRIRGNRLVRRTVTVVGVENQQPPLVLDSKHLLTDGLRAPGPVPLFHTADDTRGVCFPREPVRACNNGNEECQQDHRSAGPRDRRAQTFPHSLPLVTQEHSFAGPAISPINEHPHPRSDRLRQTEPLPSGSGNHQPPTTPAPRRGRVLWPRDQCRTPDTPPPSNLPADTRTPDTSRGGHGAAFVGS